MPMEMWITVRCLQNLLLSKFINVKITVLWYSRHSSTFNLSIIRRASVSKDVVKPNTITETGDFDYRNPPKDRDLRIPKVFEIINMHSSVNNPDSSVSKSVSFHSLSRSKFCFLVLV